MKKSSLSALVAASALFVAATVSATGGSPPEGRKGASGLDRIKSLAGEWVEVGEQGQPTDRVISSYRVTAGGHAVLEILFAGSDHEMVTVYHEDDEELVLTHYCVAGAHPHMRARKDDDPSRIVFECAGGANITTKDTRHMHQGTVTWLSQDHIQSEWLMFENGENVYTASFDLVRRAQD